MLIVGTDRMTVAGTAGAPDGPRHAVDREGRVLCRNTRPRFAWPALAWDTHRGEQTACGLCVQVRTAQEAVAAPMSHGALALSEAPAYPDETPTPTTAIVPWQPAMGLFPFIDQ
jgi:hypothetical protein